MFNLSDLTTSPTLANTSQVSPVCTYTPHLGYIYLCFSSIDGLTLLISNTFLILVLSKDDHLHTTSNILIGNLALADLLFIVNIPLEFLVQLPGDPNIKREFCVGYIFLVGLVTYLNVAAHLTMAIDRYIFIAHGIDYHRLLPERRVKLILALMWIMIGMVQAWNTWLIRQTTTYSQGECHHGLEQASPLILIAAGILVISTLLMIGIYAKIGMIAYHHRLVVNPLQGMQQWSHRFQVAKTLGCTAGFYVLCNLQIVIFMPLTMDLPCDDFRYVLQHFLLLLWRVNYWINPFIYAWMSKDFRHSMRKFIGWQSNP